MPGLLSILDILIITPPYPPRGLSSDVFYTGAGALVPPRIIDFHATVCRNWVLEYPGNLWELPEAHLQPPGASRSSFGALWSLPELIFELPGASRSLYLVKYKLYTAHLGMLNLRNTEKIKKLYFSNLTPSKCSSRRARSF